MKKLIHILFFAVLSFTGFSQAVFINEINYLPVNDQWVEIAGPTGTDLTGWEVVLYDNIGKAYDTIQLNQTIPVGEGCNGIVIVDGLILLTAPGSGLALVDASPAVVKYVTYGGSTLATDGPAAGLTSENIGTQLLDNISLQLTGTGLLYTDFIWGLPGLSTKGLVNLTQTFLDCEVPLPVELNHFSGKTSGNNIVLQWSTSSESNHSHFNIMYSPDGIEFQKIGTVYQPDVESQEFRRYNFTFTNPTRGNNYFRLHQIDLNNESSTSDLVVVEFGSDSVPMVVYPNPAAHKIHVRLDHQIEVDSIQLTLINSQGTIIRNEKLPADELSGIDVSNLKPGMYMLRLNAGNLQWQSIFVKQ